MSFRTCFVVALVFIAWSCVLGLQRPAPRYSQQYMPDTSFNCRNKIVGSYYADPETDCQLFHVCVSVAGSIQDYKFLCPNDTAFDQESQTCADWYDVDCEAATLYYASDNFDLYRLGSGLESLHYDSIRSDAEPQDHLQRSETSDPVRSSANSLNRAAQNTYNAAENGNSRDILRGSSSINFYNSRNGGKDEDYENEPVQEPKRKSGVRKIARKQQTSNNGNNANFGNNFASSSTVAPIIASSPTSNNYNGNYYNNNYNRQRTNSFPSSTTPSSVAPDNFNVRNQNNQKFNTPTTTHRPSTAQQTYSSYQSPSTTARPTTYNNNNNNNNNNAYNSNKNQQQSSNSYGQSIVTSPKPTTYSQNYPSTSVTTPKTTSYNQNFNEQPNYNTQYSQFGQNTRTQSTTVQPSTNYQSNDYYTNYQRNYNNIQRSSSSSNTFPTTIAPTTFQEAYNTNHAGNGYVPTTYRPQISNKASTNDNNPQHNSQAAKSTQYFENSRSTKKYSNDHFASQARGVDRYDSRATGNDNGQYRPQSSKSTQYYDSTRAPKKATQYNANYDLTNNGKYYETSTANYDIIRSQAAIGFSPSSINHLAETPRTTTPVPKRTAGPTTYSPQNFNSNNNNNNQQRQTQTTARSTTFASGSSARPFSTTARINEPSTTARPKSGKKNDYDYAYYDNAGGLEYDGLDLEHVVAGNKESSKIARN